MLGLLAHSSLAVGLVVIGFLTFIRFDIMGLLFGDILAVTTDDLLVIWTGGALILIVGINYYSNKNSLVTISLFRHT